MFSRSLKQTERQMNANIGVQRRQKYACMAHSNSYV